MKRKSIILIIFVSILFIGFIYCSFKIDNLTKVVAGAASLLGIYGLLYNFKHERDIAEAQFIFDLYKAFRSNEKIVNLYIKLELHFLGKEVIIDENDRKGIVEYLVFMENLASLFERNVITIKKIDPIFGFDFFIITHNLAVQEIELIPYRDYYTGTYKLYDAWLKYRKKKKRPIPLSENSLSKYEKI
ncbi:MAG TPA: hypothetical protein PL044_01070 [Clostridiales bacterium]|nr:MAG: hypothetical protein BWY37_01038 [Firmicutes bacterium ADurb.Bin262]HQH62261.1 hypothetical protein [Clostridiales bacterium]HQK72359.1 hypothetical protein [Clostridiales bacterium]